MISDDALIIMGGCGAFHRIASLAQGEWKFTEAA